MTDIPASVFRSILGLSLSVFLLLPVQSQTLTDDLGGILSFPGTRSITGVVGQAAFAPGDNTHAYVATFSGGIIRYDYDPTAATAGAIFSNPVRAVPQAISDSNEVDGSLALAFHEDPTLGTVMYIAPCVGFGGFSSSNIPLRVQSIVRLTDDNNNKVWGEAGEVNQTIVNNIVVSRLHMINNMAIRDNILWVGIGIRTQNGGQTAAQNTAAGGNGTDQSSPGEGAYNGTVAFIGDLTLLSNDTTTTNLAGFDIPGINNGVLVDDTLARADVQPFTSTDPSKLRIWATGFRNNVGLGVDDDGEIWITYNENENPQAPDKLHRAVTIKSDHKFFKGNDQMGDWRVVGDEANATLTARNQAVIDAGWFNPANEVEPFTLLQNNTAAGGLDFFPSDFPAINYAGDAMVSRNSGAGNDIVLVDRDTGNFSVVLEGLGGALQVDRDPFGNFVVGGSGAIGLIKVDDSVVPPSADEGDLLMSFGERSNAADQEVINGETWNNIKGINITDSSLQFTDGSTATGVSVQIQGTGNPVSTNPSYGPGIGYISATYDTVTAPVAYADDRNFSDGVDESITVIVDGLNPGTEYDLDLYFGLNENRGQDVTVNGQFIGHPNFLTLYQSQQPYDVNSVTADGQGQITILLSNGDRWNGTIEVALIQALGVKISETQIHPPSSFINAYLAYGGGAFGSPAEAFNFYPFLDGALFSGPNDINGGLPAQLFLGSATPADPSDAGLSVDALQPGTYSFLVQENQLVRTEYELEFVTAQIPGSTASPPPAELREAIGTDSISNDFSNPNTLVLGLGSNIVAGEVGGPGSGTMLANGDDAGTDGDYFTIVVPAGLEVTGVMVNRYNQLQRGFLIYDEGPTLSPITLQNSGIAPDKQPLFAGDTADFANYSSYSRGINRVVVAIQELPNDGADVTAADFLFRVGNDNTPGLWPAAPAPSSVSVVPGIGEGGADLVVISWADNMIQDQWLQVTVLANNNTALPADLDLDTGVPATTAGAQFYFGNARYESGQPTYQGKAAVNFTDAIYAFVNQTAPGGAAITNPFDYDRNAEVNFTDAISAFLNQRYGVGTVSFITPPGPVVIKPPFIWEHARFSKADVPRGQQPIMLMRSNESLVRNPGAP